MIARAGPKKKILGREVKELFSVNQWDSEAHFRSFYCVFFFYMYEICRRGRGPGVGGGLHQPYPVPDLRMDWKAAGKAP